MQVHSLGHRTHLMLVRWDGSVEEGTSFWVARTPTSPRFYLGNFLLYPDAPRDGDLARWSAAFRATFSDDPAIRHLCFCWDRPDGEAGVLEPFLEAGFEVERWIVLTAREVEAPPRSNREVTLRALASDDDWAAATQLQVITATDSWGEGSSAFARQQMARYRRLVAAGRGLWLGAFDGGELVADLGVFCEDGLARFQGVETAASHRRRGICATLVHHAAQAVARDLGARDLVMVADSGYHAARVYESVGFRPRERLVVVWRHADDDARS